jgi:membrane protein DedA with SNARE-associated domain
VDGILGWLQGVPVGALYALIFGAAFIEGVLPLMPGDIAAAGLAFLAARAGGALPATVAAVTIGSLLGALVMWWVGRRYGAEWLAHRLGRMGLTRVEHQIEEAEHKVEDAYRRYGWIALFVSRFLPGVRAVVPAAAGALRIPLWETMAIFAVASTIWYGGITWIAFHVGSDWASVKATLERVARDVGLGAVAVAAVLAFVARRWWQKRKAKRAAAALPPAPSDDDAGQHP